MNKIQKQKALEEFESYFVKNYPAASTISNPYWHAPRLFWAVIHAIENNSSERLVKFVKKECQPLIIEDDQ